MKPVLYEITEDALDRGLEGIPVGYSTTTYQDAKRGMIFLAGRSLNRCFDMDIEELLFLISHGYEPSRSEKLSYSHQLKESCRLPDAFISIVERHTMPMPLSELLRHAMLGMKEIYTSIEPFELLAKIPHLFGLCIRHHRRLPLRASPNIQVEYVERWFQLASLNFIEERSAQILLKKITALHLDPGPNSTEAFAARVIGSTKCSYPEALCGYLLACDVQERLKAYQRGLGFLHYFHHQATKESSYSDHLPQQRAKEIWDQLLVEGSLIHGYAQTRCPKADLLFDWAERWIDHSLVRTAIAVRDAAAELGLFPQEEAILSALFISVGWEMDEIVLNWLILSEMIGVLEQLRYDRCDAREGQGVLPFAPKYIYKRRD